MDIHYQSIFEYGFLGDALWFDYGFGIYLPFALVVKDQQHPQVPEVFRVLQYPKLMIYRTYAATGVASFGAGVNRSRFIHSIAMTCH